MLSLLPSNKILCGRGRFVQAGDVKPGEYAFCGDGVPRVVTRIERRPPTHSEPFAFSSRSWHSNNYLPNDRYQVLNDQGFIPVSQCDATQNILLPKHIDWSVNPLDAKSVEKLVIREWDTDVEVYIGYLIGTFFACGYKRMENDHQQVMLRSGIPSHASKLQRIISWLIHKRNQQPDKVKTFSTTVVVPGELHGLFSDFRFGTINHSELPDRLTFTSKQFNVGLYQGLIDHSSGHVNTNTKSVFEQALIAFLKANSSSNIFHDFPVNEYCLIEPGLKFPQAHELVDVHIDSPMGLIVDGLVLRQHI